LISRRRISKRSGAISRHTGIYKKPAAAAQQFRPVTKPKLCMIFPENV